VGRSNAAGTPSSDDFGGVPEADLVKRGSSACYKVTALLQSVEETALKEKKLEVARELGEYCKNNEKKRGGRKKEKDPTPSQFPERNREIQAWNSTDGGTEQEESD